MTTTDGQALVFRELRVPFAAGVTQAQLGPKALAARADSDLRSPLRVLAALLGGPRGVTV